MKGADDVSRSSTSVATVMKRRAVSSLSPAKERHLLADIPSQSCSSLLRPPLITTTRGAHKTKSSNLASGSRPPTKPPPLPRHSIAVSQEETCLVSAAGDVLVCRSREFSQLMAVNNWQQNGGLSPSSSSLKNSASVGWCDMECADLPLTLEKSALCNPWMTRLSSQREEKKDDDSATPAHYSVSGGLRGGSTYEWESQPADPVAQANRALGELELEVVNSTSNISPPPASPLRDPHPFEGEGDDEDRVLSMPSFDYSHFGNGGNDMVPTSPIRNRPRRPMDSAEIDVKLGLKLPQNMLQMEREPTRVSSAPAVARKAANAAVSWSAPPLFHGVPTFLTSLLQVRIKQVSAHPRGSHVLMISAEALLFSYGLNDHGQLGIGIKSPPAGKGTESGERYVWTPTIITPLLENGGKAIACAAGESHSLVVVSTEGRRVLKSKSPKADGTNSQSGSPIQMNRVSSSPPTMDTNREHRGDESEHSTSSASATAESVWHHQLYGFGRNNFMKIGLVHPRRKGSLEQPMTPPSKPSSQSNLAAEGHHDDMEDVLLPHRVALHCTVWPEKSREENQRNACCGGSALSKLPPQGIFALAASSEHSAALVRRATGDIELYTWGNAAYHALGLSQEKMSKLKPNKISPVPTLVEELSCLAKEAPEPTNLVLQSNPSEFPVDVSLGPYSTFVVTSKGRCLSFGISYDGMLGHGRHVTEVKEPRAIQFPGTNRVATVSAGTGHVMALTNCSTVFTWGKNTDGRLGLGDQHVSTADADATDLERTIEWTPQEVSAPTKPQPTLCGMPPKSSSSRVTSMSPDAEYGPVVQVCAGLDCSVFVTSCGQVLSCGKQSGRLGLGEANKDVHMPTSLFGGLRLWYRQPPVTRPPSRKASPSPAKNRPILKRGLTLPG